MTRTTKGTRPGLKKPSVMDVALWCHNWVDGLGWDGSTLRIHGANDI